jgi:hypothetical protein
MSLYKFERIDCLEIGVVTYAVASFAFFNFRYFLSAVAVTYANVSSSYFLTFQ